MTHDMTHDQVIRTMVAKLASRTPHLMQITLTREEAEVLVRFYKPMDKSQAPQTIDEMHKLLD